MADSIRTSAETAVYLAEGQAQKVKKSFGSLAILGTLAGVYIGLGAQLYTSVMAFQPEGFPLGLLKLLAAMAFSLGLILVYFAGAELFTGNCLMPMGWLSGKFGLKAMLRSWVIVYVLTLSVRWVWPTWFISRDFWATLFMGLLRSSRCRRSKTCPA